jgi:hypothetical protein
MSHIGKYCRQRIGIRNPIFILDSKYQTKIERIIYQIELSTNINLSHRSLINNDKNIQFTGESGSKRFSVRNSEELQPKTPED